MLNFKTGDLIAYHFHNIVKPLKVGIVITDDIKTFTVKWIHYNQSFFMEKDADIYGELSNTYLLTTVQIYRDCKDTGLSLLNSMYFDGEKNQQRRTSQTNSETIIRQS